MGKAPCCDKANVKKGPWSPEEDEKLKAYVEKHGTGGNWIALPRKIGLRRCGKSCRLRWLNYLRPNIRHGGFTEEEDNLISSLFISIGSRWSIIAAQLPGRTDNDIKNYWNTKLKKKLLGRSREPQVRASPSSSQESMESAKLELLPQGLRASALERIQLQFQLHGPHSSSLLNEQALWHTFQQLGRRAFPVPQESMKSDEPVQHAKPTSTNQLIPGETGFGERKSMAESTAGFMERDSMKWVSSPLTFTSFNLGLSSSPCSWDSSSPDMMFQECLLGYDP